MARGMAWSSIEKFILQIVQFSIGIVLARLLMPSDYGAVAIVGVFLVISEVFIEGGFTKALINKTSRTQSDISTVFFLNVGIGLLFTGLIWIFSHFIASYYEIRELGLYLQVLSLTLPLKAVTAIPITLISIKMDFKKLSIANLIAALVSGGIALYMAYTDYGIWALIAQNISRTLIIALLVWSFTKWKPSLIFSKGSVVELFRYGSNLLAVSLLQSLTSNLYSLFIGKYSGPAQLGIYSRGSQFAVFVHTILRTGLNRVLLPGLSPLKDNHDLLVKHTKQILRNILLVSLPIYVMLIITAKPMILFLIGSKWEESILIMQLFCGAKVFQVISNINVNLLNVLGKTNLTLRQFIVKSIIRIGLFFIALPYGIDMIALAELVSTILHYFINTYYPGKIMKYGAVSQIRDLSRIFLAGLIALSTILIPVDQYFDYFWTIIIRITVGIIVYLVAIELLNAANLKELLVLLRRQFFKNGSK